MSTYVVAPATQVTPVAVSYTKTTAVVGDGSSSGGTPTPTTGQIWPV